MSVVNKDYHKDIMNAVIKQSDRGSIVFIVMDLAKNFNVKTGKLKR